MLLRSTILRASLKMCSNNRPYIITKYFGSLALPSALVEAWSFYLTCSTDTCFHVWHVAKLNTKRHVMYRVYVIGNILSTVIDGDFCCTTGMKWSMTFVVRCSWAPVLITLCNCIANTISTTITLVCVFKARMRIFPHLAWVHALHCLGQQIIYSSFFLITASLKHTVGLCTQSQNPGESI